MNQIRALKEDQLALNLNNITIFDLKFEDAMLIDPASDFSLESFQ